jgi:hypothetical protein
MWLRWPLPCANCLHHCHRAINIEEAHCTAPELAYVFYPCIFTYAVVAELKSEVPAVPPSTHTHLRSCRMHALHGSTSPKPRTVRSSFQISWILAGWSGDLKSQKVCTPYTGSWNIDQHGVSLSLSSIVENFLKKISSSWVGISVFRQKYFTIEDAEFYLIFLELHKWSRSCMVSDVSKIV